MKESTAIAAAVAKNLSLQQSETMNWQTRLGLIFLTLAIIFNAAHYLLFRDGDYIFKFILAQLGFLPVSVFLVTIVINQLLGNREKRLMLRKLNMVIGSFYSEVGTGLLRQFAGYDSTAGDLHPGLRVEGTWTAGNYRAARQRLKTHSLEIEPAAVDWQLLRSFMAAKKNFLLSLLANPNLLEHETFSDLLWAVFHLAEEVEWRQDITRLTAADQTHLAGDITRVYSLLLGQWLLYMEHLQEDYPYLFSLAVRTNPFTPDTSAEFS